MKHKRFFNNNLTEHICVHYSNFSFSNRIFFPLFIIVMEILLIFILQITSFYTILTSILFLLYTTGSIMFCSVSAAKKIKEEYWLLWALQIIFFIAIIMIFILTIILIIVSALLSYGLTDDGGLFSQGKGEKNKDKKEFQK